MSAMTVETPNVTEAPPRGESKRQHGRAESRTRLSHWAELTRIYSWVDINVTGLLGYFAAGGGVQAVGIAGIILLSTSLWFVLNWYSEKIQHDAGREAPPWLLVGLFVAVAATVVTLWQPVAWGWLLAHFLLVGLYPAKKRVRVLSWACWLIRGAHAATFVLLAVRLVGPLTSDLWRIAGGLFLLQAARSLVAEVRDAQDDQYGLPKLLSEASGSESVAQWSCLIFSGLMALGAGILLGTIALIAVVAFMLPELWRAIGRRRNLPVAAYYLHRDFLTGSVAVKCLVDTHPPPSGTLAIIWMLTFSVASLLIANRCYDRVPRPINERVARDRIARKAELAARKACKA